MAINTVLGLRILVGYWLLCMAIGAYKGKAEQDMPLFIGAACGLLLGSLFAVLLLALLFVLHG